MIERYIGGKHLDPSEEDLYQAAIQVRGGVSVEVVLAWYASVDREDLETLLAELQEYDECQRGYDVN